MNTCRKTRRKFTADELIWKVDEKLEVRGMKSTGGDHHFFVGNIQQAVVGKVCECVETWNSRPSKNHK